ncbi:MAG: terpene cyclase/mutase family protein [Flavobacteriales bacterium]|nr:terpene cyclase/mutase family protein [Flavobacteriales bacterium]MBP8877173.1 terpene cyclase/mutase family protein [Flavobacteriales bacterium]
MIRSALDYARYFAVGSCDPGTRALLHAHRAPIRYPLELDPNAALRDAIGYLMRAQEVGGTGGLGSYHLIKGWSAPYPETTGYTIPTLIAASIHLNIAAPLECAERAADWLLSIQREDGGWQGGRVGEDRPSIVFNTAQVIRGLLAMHDVGGNQRYLDAAARAGDWIMGVQEPDGAWRTHNFLGVARVYDSYVSAPLLQLFQRTGRAAFRNAATKNLGWVLSRQLGNGWFQDADNTIQHNQRPITHTIAYTIDGLVECHQRTGDPGLLHAAELPARALAERFLRNGSLNGRYDADWTGSEAAITTGCAQLGTVWFRMHAITNDPLFEQVGQRMVQWLAEVQRRSSVGPPAMHGAVTGSYPLWGRYEKFACPNWAQKYMVDAFLCAEGVLPRY